jgi:hypothetical protein
MNKEQELENRQLQNEELEALAAIYPESFEKDPTTSDAAFIYTLNLDQDLDQDLLRSPRKVVVKFFLPPTYPNQDMPVYEIASIYCGTKKIDDAMLDAIDIGFQFLFQVGEVVLFEWINWLHEYLEENVERPSEEEPVKDVASSIANLDLKEVEEEYQPDDETFDDKKKEASSIEEDEAHDRPTVRSLMGPSAYQTEIPPAIFTSEALLDRKSSFVAHVAEVHNVHEVKVVVAHLLQNKKIAKATHNILAYRITMPDGKVLQDNDDDGESAAGGNDSEWSMISRY